MTVVQRVLFAPVDQRLGLAPAAAELVDLTQIAARRERPPAGTVMITRVTAGSSRQASSCARSARTMTSVTALSACGRLSVTSPAAPRRSNRISGSNRHLLVSQKIAAHDHAHDLVGSFEDLVHAHVAQDPLDRDSRVR